MTPDRDTGCGMAMGVVGQRMPAFPTAGSCKPLLSCEKGAALGAWGVTYMCHTRERVLSVPVVPPTPTPLLQWPLLTLSVSAPSLHQGSAAPSTALKSWRAGAIRSHAAPWAHQIAHAAAFAVWTPG